MNATIENEKEFKETIKEMGKIQKEIADRKSSIDILKMGLEIYAEKNGIKTMKAGDYLFKMVKGSQSLLRERGVSEAAVIALLKKDDEMRSFVSEIYNTKGIVAHAKSTGNEKGLLAKFNLFLSEPKFHAVVSEK